MNGMIDVVGRIIGMVTNRDLLKVFLRPDDAIKRRVVDLFSTVDGGSVAEGLTARVEAVDGVVSVVNRVTWLVDDTVNAVPAADL